MRAGLFAALCVVTVACEDSARVVRAYSELDEELPAGEPEPATEEFLPAEFLRIDPEVEVAQESFEAPTGTPVISLEPHTVKPLIPTDPAQLIPTPTRTMDGVPNPLPGVYKDLGVADSSAGIRGLIAFPIRNAGALETRLKNLYDPGHADFHKYLTAQQWIADHAPLESELAVVKHWLSTYGIAVPRTATNRLLIQFTGTVGQFNQAFGTQLRVLERKPRFGNPPAVVYGLNEGIKAPLFITQLITTVVSVDLPADPTPLPPEGGPTLTTPPANINQGLTPKQIAAAYRVDQLWAQGFRGQGVKLGVTVGASFRLRDVDGFWRMFGVQRAMPRMVITMENPATRYLESTVDVAWSGALAPEAELIAYIGPDARNTSMVYTFNEAIGLGEVNIITDSFAHREDAEPVGIAKTYNDSAKMAAALGMTVVAASGDSGEPDVPSNSPYVTAVGGTAIWMNGTNIAWEVAWNESGSGLSTRFPTPDWQLSLPNLNGRRGVADVALNAGTQYWTLFLNDMERWGGTSFSSPIFAGLIACVNSARFEQGRPAAGWLNRALYTMPAVRGSFRDITQGQTTTGNAAGVGYDLATGWGAPKADALLQALP